MLYKKKRKPGKGQVDFACNFKTYYKAMVVRTESECRAQENSIDIDLPQIEKTRF